MVISVTPMPVATLSWMLMVVAVFTFAGTGE
jgi:hypothetical protein